MPEQSSDDVDGGRYRLKTGVLAIWAAPMAAGRMATAGRYARTLWPSCRAWTWTGGPRTRLRIGLLSGYGGLVRLAVGLFCVLWSG